MVTPIPIDPNETLARSATTVLDRRKAIRVDLQRERGRADQAEARADRAEQTREAERTRMDALRDQVDGLQAQLAQVRAGAETTERTMREALNKAEAEAAALRQADQERRRHDLADYVSYVQERWAEDKRANAIEISIAGRLLIPLRNIDGELRSLQIIDDQGGKMFGGEVAGSHCVIGDAKSPWPLHFAEGYVTGLASRQATGHAVVVTFSAHNIEPVAVAYRERFPDKTFFIDADNDHQKAREADAQGRPKKNTGKERAEAAAQRVGGHVLLPPFSEEDKGKDWDDYRRQHGAEGLQLELTKQTACITRQKIAREFAAAREYGRETNTRTMALVR